MSRRERLYLISGVAVLLFGVVVYPATKKAAVYRETQREMLEDEMALLEDLYGLYYDAPAIEEENELLLHTLRKADDLLFPPIANPILTQTAMIKLMNELGPDLELETTSGRSSVGDAANQMNLTVRGEGRYPEILKFMHRLESYRPLILVESFSMSERRGGGGRGGRGGRSRLRSTVAESGEPRLALNLSIQIICQEGAE
jgi:hypothetical protein